jgi:hypothetical protein
MRTGRSALAELVRAKIAAGRLPRERPQRIWVGPGPGKGCDACDSQVTSDQREYEFDPPGWRTIRLHAECLEQWHLARMNLGSGPMPGAHSSDLNTTAVRTASVLRDAPGGYCIECLSAKIDVSLREARDAAHLLIVRPGFAVVERECCACGRSKDGVIAFVPCRRQ